MTAEDEVGADIWAAWCEWTEGEGRFIKCDCKFCFDCPNVTEAVGAGLFVCQLVLVVVGITEPPMF